jgi:hypothetical protein
MEKLKTRWTTRKTRWKTRGVGGTGGPDVAKANGKTIADYVDVSSRPAQGAANIYILRAGAAAADPQAYLVRVLYVLLGGLGLKF